MSVDTLVYCTYYCNQTFTQKQSLKYTDEIELVTKINDFSCNVSHAGDTMNSLSQRSTRGNTISEEPADSTVVAKSKRETKVKTTVVSYDYEAAISQPDIPTCSKADNNTQESCLDILPTPHEKASFFSTCGKMGVTIKRRGVGVRSKMRPKKIARARTQINNIFEIKKGPMFHADVCRDVVTGNHETPPNIHQVCSKYFQLR